MPPTPVPTHAEFKAAYETNRVCIQARVVGSLVTFLRLMQQGKVPARYIWEHLIWILIMVNLTPISLYVRARWGWLYGSILFLALPFLFTALYQNARMHLVRRAFRSEEFYTYLIANDILLLTPQP